MSQEPNARKTVNEALSDETAGLRSDASVSPPAGKAVKPPEPNPCKTFNEVLFDEVGRLRPGAFADLAPTTVDADKPVRADNLRTLYGAIGKLKAEPGKPGTGPLSALCFSGGGIRSATFNLGILQVLAKYRLIDKFDYLSSVSGGGYIASWVRTWMWRADSPESMQDALAGKGNTRNPLAPEPKPLDHLREYSNYLTPKLGLFSPDTWTLAAIAVRNLLLNWLVIVPLLSVVSATPLFVLLLVMSKGWNPQTGDLLLRAAIGMALFASFATHFCRRFAKGPGMSQGLIVTFSIVPTCLAATLLSTAALGLGLPGLDAHAQPPAPESVHAFAALWCIGIPLAGWIATEAIFLRRDGNFRRPALWIMALWELIGLVISGVIAAGLLVLLVRGGLPLLHGYPDLYAVLAFPTLLALYLLARTIFVGFASLADRAGPDAPAFGLEDSDREWWARLSGWVLMAATLWLLLSVIAIFGTHVLRQLESYRGVAHGLVGALGGLSGIFAAAVGASSKTAGSEASKEKAARPAWMGWIMALAAPLFAVCMFVLVAQATILVEEALLKAITDVRHPFRYTEGVGQGHHHALLPAECLLFLIVPGACVLIALALGNVVNVNRFSLHGMYRNRLVRAYLGASNVERKPDPFTGFADDDNPSLHQLWPPTGAARPLPLINATLNLVQTGDKLAWQQRKAESFSMTPLYCGNFFEGYRASTCYGGPHGISLGTAVTISGAAANPNMGSSSSPAISFLLALFNLRLGAWLGNTSKRGDDTCKRTGPSQAVLPLVAELFGLTTAKNPYINLSDGGHFDNLGLYEIVLRRCRNIVVCDAGQDPTFSFEDLGNAIRKIRIDFGIPIEFKHAIRVLPRDAKGRGVYCALADVRYSAIDASGPQEDGKLVYVKPTLRARGRPIPYDVFSYAQAKPTFPHESTADQWFSESQFESYRVLSMHALEAIVGDADPCDPGELVASVESYLLRMEEKRKNRKRRRPDPRQQKAPVDAPDVPVT